MKVLVAHFSESGNTEKLARAIDEGIEKKPEHRAWAEEARGAASHPDAADLEDGKDFAKNMMKKSLS